MAADAPGPAPAASEAGPADGASGATSLDLKIAELIKAKEAEAEASSTRVHSFNRILLKFPFIRKTMRSIKRVFDEFDADKSGTIEYDELANAMAKFGTSAASVDVEEVFANADFYDNKQLTFREFVVSLALGYLLGQIPILDAMPVARSDAGAAVKEANAKQAAMDAGEDVEVDTEQPAARSRRSQTISRSKVQKMSSMSEGQLLGSEGAAIAYSFTLVLEAFFYFDPKHTGMIKKEELASSMAALSAQSGAKGVSPHGHSGEALSFLTEERYNELDWDHDGSVTFKEFLFAFMAWVGLDDEDSDEDEE